MKGRGGRLILVVRIFMRCVQSFVYLSVSFVFPEDFQERHRQIPDVGRGEQIVCDKRIVGADELLAERELRDISFTGHGFTVG